MFPRIPGARRGSWEALYRGPTALALMCRRPIAADVDGRATQFSRSLPVDPPKGEGRERSHQHLYRLNTVARIAQLCFVRPLSRGVQRRPGGAFRSGPHPKACPTRADIEASVAIWITNLYFASANPFPSHRRVHASSTGDKSWRSRRRPTGSHDLSLACTSCRISTLSVERRSNGPVAVRRSSCPLVDDSAIHDGRGVVRVGLAAYRDYTRRLQPRWHAGGVRRSRWSGRGSHGGQRREKRIRVTRPPPRVIPTTFPEASRRNRTSGMNQAPDRKWSLSDGVSRVSP